MDESIKQRVLAVIDSGSFILGKESQLFEQALAAHTGTKHCVLSSSWTAAVYLLLHALKIKAGDEILVPSHTAFPTIEPMIHLGAKPIFVDVDESYTMNVDLLESLRTPRTVGIIPVHLYGHPAQMDRIKAFAQKHGLFLIEDCAQAHGATWNGQRVGSIGDFGAFSFYPSKNLTVCGDGGCITTHDDAVAARIRMLRDHGRRDKYVHEIVGFNLRFNEIQACIGREQLQHLDEFNQMRRKAVSQYRERLASIPQLQLPTERSGTVPVYHMFVIQVDRRDDLARFLKEKGIGTGVHYPVPNHQQPAITSLYKDLPKLPVTEKAVGRILSLPMFPQITEQEVDTVCKEIKAFYSQSNSEASESEKSQRKETMAVY
jgi:dTDP-4-amino-4,6-dideoxygalactose transaminase